MSLELDAFELGIHNLLYERWQSPVISDAEYDALNAAYFRKCLDAQVQPNPCLNPDTGLMNPGPLNFYLSRMSYPQLVQHLNYIKSWRQDPKSQ
jgi:hypothetical protein